MQIPSPKTPGLALPGDQWYTLAKLRDILGHDNTVTTDRYSHANAQRMQEMVEGP
jgi:hypothetical protein